MVPAHQVSVCPKGSLRTRSRGPDEEINDRSNPEQLLRGDQGHRRRWRRRERGQPDDRGRPEGRRVHRSEHRRSGVAHERRRPQAGHRPPADQRARGRERSDRRAGSGRRAPRRHRRGPAWRGHGLHHSGKGWRNRNGCRAGRGRDREEPRCPHDRSRDEAVHLRGPEALGSSRAGHPATEGKGRRDHHHPERQAL